MRVNPYTNVKDDTQVLPVLISGAGPTGLFAALLLARMGIPVRIIERDPTPCPLSKALGLHARSMEIFALTREDIIDEILRQGRPFTDFHFYFGNKLAGVMPLRVGQDSKYSFGLGLEQAKICEILRTKLEEVGVKVEYGWELIETQVVKEDVDAVGHEEGKTLVLTKVRKVVSKDGKIMDHARDKAEVDGIQSDVNDRDNINDTAGQAYEYQTIKSEYLIAADGGRSTIRHKLNIPFPGRTVNSKWVMLDGRIECDIPSENIAVIEGNNYRSLVLFPFQYNGKVRVTLDAGPLSPGEEISKTAAEMTVEKFESLVAECIAPAKFKVLEHTWLTCYGINERRAPTSQHQGRIFLVGDAAHVHSPAGGQGMNTGLQDAYNLAWKLAFVFRGVAPASMLDTYTLEREPMADHAIKISSELFERSSTKNFIQRNIKRAMLTILPYIIPRYSETSPAVSMIHLRYHENAINQPHAIQPFPATNFQVGVRAADGLLVSVDPIAPVDNGQATSLRLHQILVGTGVFHILVFTSDLLGLGTEDQTLSRAQGLVKNLDRHLKTWRSNWSLQLQAKPKDMFQIHVLATKVSSPVSSAAEDKETRDRWSNRPRGDGRLYLESNLNKSVHSKYGVPPFSSTFAWASGAIVVVRPDSYIGYRVLGIEGSAWNDVDGYLRSVLTNPPSN
ncbi:hypothetical protein BGX34_001624 [Mortierella sp. NVP85]|nr:hypothetical protein BGX34_001624 [Mortierella sp. NVP85]